MTCINESELEELLSAVSAEMGGTAGELLGADRHEPLASARKMALYLAWDGDGVTLACLAQSFRRHYTTVWMACRLGALLEKTDSRWAKQAAAVRCRLRKEVPVAGVSGEERR